MDVLLVDDHPIIHEVMREVVRRAIPNATFCAETDLDAGIARGRALRELGLALIDLGLPGYQGIEALVTIRYAFPRVTAVVISANDEQGSVRDAMEAGAAGYILKTSKPDVMIAALQLIVTGGIYLPPPTVAVPAANSSKQPAAHYSSGMTGRQAEVLRLLARGLSYREIARDLRIAEATVKQHAHAVYKTLGVSSRVQAVIALSRRVSRSD